MRLIEVAKAVGALGKLGMQLGIKDRKSRKEKKTKKLKDSLNSIVKGAKNAEYNIDSDLMKILRNNMEDSIRSLTLVKSAALHGVKIKHDYITSIDLILQELKYICNFDNLKY
jgi:hypothetical protein